MGDGACEMVARDHRHVHGQGGYEAYERFIQDEEEFDRLDRARQYPRDDGGQPGLGPPYARGDIPTAIRHSVAALVETPRRCGGGIFISRHLAPHPAC